MEPPRGALAKISNFICFLPYFTGLLLLGTIKGVIFCPLACLIITIGNSAIILGLWPIHCFWTCYCILRSKQLGPGLKLVLVLCMPIPLILWPVLGIAGSVVGGIAYGFLSPIFATFDAVGEEKTNEFFHCFYDGTWSTVKGSFTIVRDFKDVCFHSYLSYMDDLQHQEPAEGKYHEIRLLYLPGTVVVAVLGFMVDMLMISLIALYKSPYMLFKGWHRLFHDLIGREGPFLETICVPFAGLAIILWPLAVVGAVLASMLSSIFLGAFAGVVVYQECSIWLGLCYVVASLAIYDEYSNDILDMQEGSCFPRPNYRRQKARLSKTSSLAASISKPAPIKGPPARTVSLKDTIIELNPLELLNGLFDECQRYGESMVSEGLIIPQDIEDAKASRGSGVISIGLPTYCLLQVLLRSVKANSMGILLRDNTEVTSTNKPKDAFYDWFLNPLLVIKEQIKAENVNVAEEDYLCKLVLLSADPERFKNSYLGPPPETERKRAELEALARRLRGITKSISRYPTFRRRFDTLVKKLSEDLARKNIGSKSNGGSRSIKRSKSAFVRKPSQKSFKSEKASNGSVQGSQHAPRDVDIA
ncbi:uncharacterized membrane protein At3g27390-like isoform X1 [Syzygium oleosum]|uniref:uncharacterized membrane protein At3g27390-like isoform X1 n=2 Tax=Syzygium oleosum TaxID=219896 RepID=UPI0024BBC67C|nr:uncharacterized membrane protein At3g27390-like isoform X1 [Syzygium oleosum]XP_056170070.1 uncharacterized membrane protein At3g27390-like isoform X1 [Syzygium oleosum]XP_056170071.1 uncharacterized membrane protein At3g27390-like isoform X1 [Syzygium oleosum]